jgi:hypothetical protein
MLEGNNMLKQFRDIWVSIACLFLVVIMVVGVTAPNAVGGWLAQVEQAQKDSMNAYWCQEHICDNGFNEFGEMIND